MKKRKELRKKNFQSIIQLNKRIEYLEKLEKEREPMFSFLRKLFLKNRDVNSDEVTELKQKVKDLEIYKKDFNSEKKRVEKLEKELVKFRDASEKSDQKVTKLTTDLESEKNQKESLDRNLIIANRKVSELENEKKSDVIKKLNNLYEDLNETTKSGVQNILKAKAKTSILVSGVLNIESLWHYTAHLRNEHKDKEFAKLKLMVETLLEEYKNIADVKIQNIKIGDDFDDEVHIRDNRSLEMDGKVEKVILKGFSVNGRLIKQSIVKVR